MAKDMVKNRTGGSQASAAELYAFMKKVCRTPKFSSCSHRPSVSLCKCTRSVRYTARQEPRRVQSPAQHHFMCLVLTACAPTRQRQTMRHVFDHCEPLRDPPNADHTGTAPCYAFRLLLRIRG